MRGEPERPVFPPTESAGLNSEYLSNRSNEPTSSRHSLSPEKLGAKSRFGVCEVPSVDEWT